MTKIAVFASGTGSNFEAIAEAIDRKELNATICLVVSDKASAPVLQKAKDRGIATFSFNPKEYNSKGDYEKEIEDVCKKHGAQWLILAGYMRILSPVLLKAYPNRIVNIHPSLLPAFKGARAIEQAIDAGVKVMGVTIHYVNEEMDGGQIIAQEAFDVGEMTHEEIERRVHEIEHRLYCETLHSLLKEEKG